MANPPNIAITSVTVTFAAGVISTVTVNYQNVAGQGVPIAGTYLWQLSASEQSNTAGFVANLIAKLSAMSGLTVTTT